MAYNEAMVALLRNALSETGGLSERKMFGGLAFLVNGHMVCGVHSGGGMFRVGKVHEAIALTIDGARAMDFTGRKMGGFIEVTDDALLDDARRSAWLSMALEHAQSLPPKAQQESARHLSRKPLGSPHSVIK